MTDANEQTTEARFAHSREQFEALYADDKFNWAIWLSAWQARQHEIDTLKQQLAAAQVKIDSLMLEYCPDEMTIEQFVNWAEHQQPVKEYEND